jgi:cytochrome c peroxidase
MQWFRSVTLAAALGLVGLGFSATLFADGKDPYDADLPNDSLKIPFASDVPVYFVTRSTPAEWNKLSSYWNEATEDTTDPVSGAKVTRKVIKIKVPLGLNTAPVSPVENPITLAKWELGKKLYFDPILSSNNTVSCATCHNPEKGYGDQRKTSLGINSKLGGVNAPTVLNSGLHKLQFWDGRAASLEEQAQGPPGNPSEMFAGKGEPWEEAVVRLRKSEEYVKMFKLVFGHGPTRDAAAKAIAAYERTVLSGNSIHDRADQIMRKRVNEEESGKFEFKGSDYANAVKAAFENKDEYALKALGLDLSKDAGKTADIGESLAKGQALFVGKARCTNCHVGENFTDNGFHNLGIGADAGKLPQDEFGRYTRLATGHKDPSLVGAFKTPGLRGLVESFPYMHNGEEKTLEAVVELYDRGGNINEFLSPKMRDTASEDAYLKAKATGKEYAGPKPELFTRSGRPVIPFKLNLTAKEKADLVLFLKALQGDAIPEIIANPVKFTSAIKVSQR